MAITQISTVDRPRGGHLDYIAREKERLKRQDVHDTFKAVSVEVDDGPVGENGRRPTSKVNLRYAVGQHYLFAVYGQNADFANRSADEWGSCAKDALEKYAALKGLQIKMGPRAEDTNRYNYMIETDRPIEPARRPRKRDEDDEIR